MQTITLAGRSYAVPALTLGQIRLLLDGLDELAGKSGGALVLAAARIIEAGLQRSAPELTAEAVLGLEATLDEVNAAVATIIQAAGLVRPEVGTEPDKRTDAAAGEAGPVAAGSPSSTGPSPPAAATPIR